MSDIEGREEEAAYERWLARPKATCGDCGGFGDEHAPSCPFAPEPDLTDDEEPVQGMIAFAGELLKAARDA